MEVRWGFIGAGSVTERKASPRGAFTQPGSRVVAVARPALARAQEYARQNEIARAYDRVEDLCADPAVDAVYICTPHHLHREHALLAIRAGKHVLCEKPMANTTEECGEMVRAAERAGVILGLAYYRRFYPAIEKLREIVDSGRLGTLISAHVVKKEHYVPSPTEATSSRRDAWRTNLELAGGGTLNESGSHRLDLLFYFLGQARSVSAELERFEAWYEGEDQANVTIRFANRAVAQVDVSWCSQPKCDLFLLGGTRGLVTIPDLEATDVQVQVGNTSELVRVAPHADATHRPVVADFVRAIAEGGNVRCPGTDGLLTTQIVELAYLAAKQGRSVGVTPA